MAYVYILSLALRSISRSLEIDVLLKAGVAVLNEDFDPNTPYSE
jgi:hypothetical protein